MKKCAVSFPAGHRVYHDCFSGATLVDWLLDTRFARDDDYAHLIGQALLARSTLVTAEPQYTTKASEATQRTISRLARQESSLNLGMFKDEAESAPQNTRFARLMDGSSSLEPPVRACDGGGVAGSSAGSGDFLDGCTRLRPYSRRS